MEKNPRTDLMIWFVLYVLARIVGELVAMLMLLLAAGNLEGVSQMMSLQSPAPDLRKWLLTAQGTAHFIIYTLTAVLIIYIVDSGRYFVQQSYRKRDFLKTGAVFIASFLLFLPLLEWVIFAGKAIKLPGAIGEVFHRLDMQAEAMTNFVLDFGNVYEFAMGILVMAVLPAVGEELLFRGVLQQKFIRYYSNPHLAVWMTAVLFSFFHFQFAGFLPRMLLGAFFGYVYLYTKHIVFPILLHFINNAMTVSVAYFSHRSLTDLQNQSPGEWWDFALAMLYAAVAWLLFRWQIKQLGDKPALKGMMKG